MLENYLNIPQSYSLIEKGNIIPLNKSVRIESVEDILSYLDKYGSCVIKPTRCGGGIGIHILKKVDDLYFVNSTETSLSELKQLISSLDNYYLSEFIEQGNFSKEFHPATTNTIRVLTMVDPDDTNKPFIAIAVQRIGNSTSIPVDNWTQGGLSAEIDLDNGELGSGITYPKNGVLERHDYHPETGGQIKGKVVPNWEELKNNIINAASAVYPYIKYVGWDVIVTDNGYSILEGNTVSDVNLLQVHRPLLKDERVVKFYRHHGIID